jgi:isochorismate hydrolase
MQRRLGRDCVVVVGVFTSTGCNSSARDAFMRDIRVFAVADAVADYQPSGS